MLFRSIATVVDGYVRHHAENLARELILLHAERSVRIAGNRYGAASCQVEETQGGGKI